MTSASRLPLSTCSTRARFRSIAFTGANAPTTVERFPRGEAVHYREYALDHGAPTDAVLIETEAKNTSENLTLTRDLLADRGANPGSVLLMSRPYQQRRAYATCGDTQRIEVYARKGYAIPQDVPADVRAAYDRLVEAGYTSRLVA
jgi:hypothetical protein